MPSIPDFNAGSPFYPSFPWGTLVHLISAETVAESCLPFQATTSLFQLRS